VTESDATWTDLDEGILVRQSKAFWMNSVVLLDAEHTVIVDPGVLPSELDDLARVVHEAAPEALTLFFTHGHWDHVLGRPWWPEAKTLAHDRLAAEVKRDRESITRDAQTLAAEHGERWANPFAPFHTDIAVSGLRFMPLGPWRLVFRDAPGHSDSQLSCHLTDQRLLIAADMLSDIEPPILDGPVAPYRATLEALLPLAEHDAIETLVPGHGAIAHGRGAVLARIARDLEYLQALEDGVNAAIGSGLPLEATQEMLAAMDYTGRRSETYPTERFHLRNIEFVYRGATVSRR
jgi:hydroxyacylglutathione hydrolase